MPFAEKRFSLQTQKLDVVLATSARPCPACHSHECHYLHRMYFVLPETSPLPAHYDLAVCRRCGSGFADSEARASDYDDHYRSFSKYEDPGIATGGGDEPMDRQRLETLAAFLSRHALPGARIADIGCGNGGLLKELRKNGFEDLTGFDPSRVCVERIRATGMNAHTIVLPAEHLWWSTRNEPSFDLIILSHVLEHVFDAQAVLKSVLALLAPGGKIYIEVPDPAGYDLQNFPPLYFFDPEHINHFGRGSLTYFAHVLGLSIVEMGQKKIRLQNGVGYPAIFGLFETGMTAFEPGESLYSSLSKYVEESIEGVTQLRTRLLALMGNETPFVLWGAGSLAQPLIGEPWFPLHSLLAIVDRDSKKQGLHFAGKLILSPEVGLQNLPDNTLVICAAAVAADQIEQDYRALGVAYPFHSIVDGEH